MDMSFEQFEDILYTAQEAVLESLAVAPEPVSATDAVKMFTARLIDDLTNEEF